MAGVALAERVVEKYLLPARRDNALERQWQLDIRLPAERKLESLQGVQLFIRRQSKIEAGNAIGRFGEMLNYRAGRKRSQGPVPRCAVAGPTGPRPVATVNRGWQGQGMGNTAHVEIVRQVIESVLVFQDERQLPHQTRVFEVIGEIRISLRDKQRIIIG